MQTVFSNAPDPDNMVTQPGPYESTDILCVECGWESIAFPPAAPWPTFMQHPCRLTAWSQSTFK